MTMLPLDRRALLKGLGVSVALPMLESMMPGLAFTATGGPSTVPPAGPPAAGAAPSARSAAVVSRRLRERGCMAPSR